jgi:hypothetical protein
MNRILLAVMVLCMVVSPAHARHHHHRRHHHVPLPQPRPEGVFNFGFPGETVFPLLKNHDSDIESSSIMPHPQGCPWRAFCGCGAAVRVFGAPIKSLWAAASWFRFPRAAPATGMVAVRRHHVFVLDRQVSGNVWLSYDANSGHHLTRYHAKSLSGYTIVNPRG